MPAVEGTALVMSRDCWDAVGGMDLSTFGRYGWGLDLDLALRARKSGYGLYTTEMAYINHFGRKTANTHFGGHRYHWGASAAMIRGLRRTHGWPAAMGILREMGMAHHHRKWHKSFPLTCPASC